MIANLPACAHRIVRDGSLCAHPVNAAKVIDWCDCANCVLVDADYIPAVVTMSERDSDCQYRGEVVQTQQCPTCRGRVEIKVFSCSNPLNPHGRCQLAAKFPDVPVCGSLY